MSRSLARALRKNPTDAERVLWQRLRLRNIAGFKFRRQQALGPYIVDFVCFEKRLVVEVDGGQHVRCVRQDARRTAWLSTQGFRVLRFWNMDVIQFPDDVAEVIQREVCGGEAPPTSILPRKGGGSGEAVRSWAGEREASSFPPRGGRAGWGGG